jgi:hypothetical protein
MRRMFEQISRTVYVDSKCKLRMYCVCDNNYATVLFFVSGSVNYRFWIVLVSQLSVHPLLTITLDNRKYTLHFYN